MLTDTLLDGRPVLRLNAADTGFALPSLEDAWDILLIDNIQDMQEERDWQALCALIRESTDRRFLLLSRGIPAACLMAFQYQKRDEAWREPLTAALALAEEYRFIRTVSAYGAAVLPLLNALEWSGNAKWHKRLMADVRAQAAIYPPFFAAKAFHERGTDGSGDAGAAADLRGQEQCGDPEHPGLHGQEPCEQRAQ